MKKSAYWDHDKINRLQNKNLRYIIKYAYNNVPFYHNKYKKLGINPNDIKNIKDLERMPIIGKDEIRNNYADLISKEYKIYNLKKISTSGSTGKPLLLWISQDEDEIRKANHLRANISCGQKIRDKWVIITSPHHFGSSTKLQRLLGIYVPRPVSVFKDIDSQVEDIEKMKPDVLDGYTSSLLLLAKEVHKRKIRTINPRFILGGAELIDDSSIRFIENVFGVPFYDHYSCIEFDSISWQCKEKLGYHIDAESLVLEFIDENGENCTGKTGEIVCTSLFNRAMPLIRYDIGDVGVMSDDECPCGRTLPMMKMVEGRRDSLLFFPNGRVMSPRSFTVAISTFKHYTQIDQFRFVQKKIDNFEIYIKMKDYNVNTDILGKEIVNYLRKTLYLDPDLVDFDVKFVDNMPLDKTGKLMMVVSKLPKKDFRI